jgi:8-oxo-dGTP diphosphatase
MLAEDGRGNALLEFDRLDEAALASVQPLTHAVVAARRGDAQLLVFSRKRQWWELPGGAMERHETARECAVRELREESGVVCRAESPRFVGALKILVRARRSRPEPRVEYGALFTLDDGPAVGEPFEPNEEIVKICWWNGADDIGPIGAIDRTLIALAWPA